MDGRKIRPATPEDLAAILDILDAARHIMWDSGNLLQWVPGYPAVATIQADIEQGGGFVFEEEDPDTGAGRIVGYFACLPSPEPTYRVIYDGAWLDDTQPYHVVHRLASYPDVHGIFQEALDFSFALNPNIRIDTHRDNAIMRHLIRKAGFSYCGIIHLANGDERLAYQKIDRS